MDNMTYGKARHILNALAHKLGYDRIERQIIRKNMMGVVLVANNGVTSYVFLRSIGGEHYQDDVLALPNKPTWISFLNALKERELRTHSYSNAPASIVHSIEELIINLELEGWLIS